MKAIVICSKKENCLPVLFESIDQYVQDNVTVYMSGSSKTLKTKNTINFPNIGTTFGESYNHAVKRAFQNHDELIVSNDDVVLNPNTWQLLCEDVNLLKEKYGESLGWVATRSNVVRPQQCISDSELIDDCINERLVVAPIFAYINKKAWIDFPEINWYSDDIQCYDMCVKGNKHFVSRSYVHHVGSNTIGLDKNALIRESLKKIIKSRPDMIEHVLTMMGVLT